MKIENRVIVVTGGGDGIGRQVVLELLRRGGRVAAVDLSAERLGRTAELVAGLGRGGSLTTHTVDVTDADAVAGLPELVVAAHGVVDGVVNVAGIIQRFAPVTELSETDMTRVMDVNLWGPVRLCRAFVPLLRARPEACVVNVSSMGALTPVPGQTMYGASKAALALFTQGLGAELRDTRVAVTVVYPGGVATAITQNSGTTIPGVSADSDMVSSLTTPEDAARQIVVGIERGSYRVVIGKDARAVDALSRLSPRRAAEMVASRMASLLKP